MAGRNILSSLPPELRDMVYGFYFAPPFGADRKRFAPAVEILLRDARNLCRAYPSLRHEILTRFYKNHRIVALNMVEAERFFRHLALHPRPLRPLIRGCIRFPGVFEPRAQVLHKILALFVNNARWTEPVAKIARDNGEMESLAPQDAVVSFFKMPRLAPGNTLLLTSGHELIPHRCSIWLRELGEDGSVMWRVKIVLEHLCGPFDIDRHRLVLFEFDSLVLWSRGVFRHCAVTFEGDIGHLIGFMKRVVK